MRNPLTCLVREPLEFCYFSFLELLWTQNHRSENSNMFYRCKRSFEERQHCGEPAISLHSHHASMFQWTTRLLPVMRDLGSIPRGALMYVKHSPVSVVSLHWWPRHDWSLWPGLRRALSRMVTRPLYQHLISHSSSVPVSSSLHVLLLALQPT